MSHAGNEPSAKALIESIRSNDLTTLRSLLESDIDVNAVVRGCTALGVAVENGSARIVKLLLAAGADPDRGARIDPLHEAIREKRLAMAEALVKAGADINRKIDHGTTPLMIAVFTGSAKAVQLLLDARADAKIENDDLECAYEIALDRKKYKIAELLEPVSDSSIKQRRQSGHNLEKLFEAAERGDEQELLRVIGMGIDVNAIAPTQCDTALAEASWNGHVNIVAALLDAGASPNIYGSWPSIAKAASRGHIFIIKKLLEAGADVNAFSAGDETALMRAAEEALVDASSILLDAGADVNASGRIGKTPLSQAYDYEWRYRKRNPVVDLLFEYGADNLGAYEKAYSNWKRPEK